jgi:hypothetical protein
LFATKSFVLWYYITMNMIMIKKMLTSSKWLKGEIIPCE